MKESKEMEKQLYRRMIELSDLARQRYLDAGGDPRRAADDRYMTNQEKKEYLELGRLVFGVKVSNGEVHCQGRSWKLPVTPQK